MNLPALARSACRWLPPCLVVLLAALASATTASAATITVDTTVDDDLGDGECSLREAILAANTDSPHNDCPAGSGPDRIVFSLAKGVTIALGSALPTITDTLLVRGPGADLLTVDGQDLHPILDFDPPTLGRWLGVEEVTLTRGLAGVGGGASIASGQNGRFHRVILFANRANSGGGGMFINGDDTASSRFELDECWFRENESLGSSGGGGLVATAPGLEVVVDRTTFSGNRATAGSGNGGGLTLNRASVRIERSTFSANEAADYGGAIVVYATTSSALLALRDVTVTANRANSDSDADGGGGGIATSIDIGQTATLELANSILAGNLDPSAAPSPDTFLLSGSLLTVASSGFNLIGSNAGAETFFAAGAPNPGGDYIGTAAAPIDPKLNPLADQGGFAPDHRPAIVAGTPVIDKGFCTGSPADQRGYGDAVSHLRIVETLSLIHI